MDSIITLLLGVAIGTYYAESIREKVPVLDPKPNDGSGASNE